MGKKIKILIVDDHKIVRRGLSLLLSNENDFTVIGEAGNGRDALDLMEEKLPDVLISDITMPEMNGFELTKIISKKYPTVKVVMLSMHVDEEYVINSMDAGALGYVSKDDDGDNIISAVYAVNKRDIYLTDKISNLLAMGVVRADKKKKKKKKLSKLSKESVLTKREAEILTEIAKGKSTKEVASDLSISLRTVNVHKYNMMKKLDASNVVSLVRIAIDKKVIQI